MLAKPDTCKPCPMYQTGRGFVPDEIIEGAEVMVVAQNPGETEENDGKPLVGKSGHVFNTEFLAPAGLSRGTNVSIGNVLKCRWKGANNLPLGKILKESVEICTTNYLQIPESTKLVVAQGALAAKVLSGDWDIKINDWRGFILP